MAYSASDSLNHDGSPLIVEDSLASEEAVPAMADSVNAASCNWSSEWLSDEGFLLIVEDSLERLESASKLDLNQPPTEEEVNSKDVSGYGVGSGNTNQGADVIQGSQSREIPLFDLNQLPEDESDVLAVKDEGSSAREFDLNKVPDEDDDYGSTVKERERKQFIDSMLKILIPSLF